MVSTALLLGVVLLVGGTATVYALSRAATADGWHRSAQSGPLIVNQEAIESLAPGAPAQLLHGNFTNPNNRTIRVSSVTARISDVRKASRAPAGPCDTTDYTLANPNMKTNQDVPIGQGVGTWSGARVAFNNKSDTNQDGCIGAQVIIAYTVR